MNKSSFHTTAVMLVLAALSAAPHAANAVSDAKSMSPMGCRPLTATDATGLAFDTRGIINSTTVDKRVICEIDKDLESAYSAANTALIVIWFKPGAVDGSVSCTFYRGSAATPVMTTTSGSSGVVTAGAAANSFNMNLDTYPNDFTGIGQNLVCTLTAKMTLAHFYFVESGATDTP